MEPRISNIIKLLGSIAAHPEMIQEERCHTTEISMSALSTTFAWCDKNGYISRTSSKEDTRITHSVLTNKGKVMLSLLKRSYK